MTSLPAVVAALLLASRPDLQVPRPPPSGASLDPGAFRAGELLGAGAGVLAGDALFLASAWGTYRLFVDGQVPATASSFRTAGITLATAALLLPALGATLGARLGGAGPGGGAAWKAFLLSLLANTGALAAAFLAMPAVWVALPVQLAAMTAGASLGLHWGPRPGGIVGRGIDLEARAPAPRISGAGGEPTPFELATRICPDPAAGP